MAILTPTILENLGITLSSESFQSLSEHFETTLDERVINEIIVELSPEKAQELANLHQADDETVAKWLKDNVPDIAEIVADEVDILLGEIAESGNAFE